MSREPKSNVVGLPPKRGDDLTHRDLSWLYQRIEKAREGIFCEVVTVTVDIAKRLLENNSDNRRVSERTVNQIAADIKAGNWQLNGETIVVSVDGELNDGAHRLLAVIQAETPVQSLVAFGLPRTSRMTVDVGRARKVADFLHMAGAENAVNAAAVARICLAFSRKDYKGMTVTKLETRVFYEREKTVIDYAISFARRSEFCRAVSVNAVAAAYWLIHAANSTQCAVFFDAFATGAELERDSPILWLRQRVGLAPEERLRSEHRVEIILRYWNAWRSDSSMKKHLPLKNEIPRVLQ